MLRQMATERERGSWKAQVREVNFPFSDKKRICPIRDIFTLQIQKHAYRRKVTAFLAKDERFSAQNVNLEH